MSGVAAEPVVPRMGGRKEQNRFGTDFRHLVAAGENVEGLIIARADDAVRRAHAAAGDVGLRLHEVEFRLRKFGK